MVKERQLFFHNEIKIKKHYPFVAVCGIYHSCSNRYNVGSEK